MIIFINAVSTSPVMAPITTAITNWNKFPRNQDTILHRILNASDTRNQIFKLTNKCFCSLILSLSLSPYSAGFFCLEGWIETSIPLRVGSHDCLCALLADAVRKLNKHRGMPTEDLKFHSQSPGKLVRPASNPKALNSNYSKLLSKILLSLITVFC